VGEQGGHRTKAHKALPDVHALSYPDIQDHAHHASPVDCCASPWRTCYSSLLTVYSVGCSGVARCYITLFRPSRTAQVEGHSTHACCCTHVSEHNRILFVVSQDSASGYRLSEAGRPGGLHMWEPLCCANCSCVRPWAARVYTRAVCLALLECEYPAAAYLASPFFRSRGSFGRLATWGMLVGQACVQQASAAHAGVWSCCRCHHENCIATMAGIGDMCDVAIVLADWPTQDWGGGGVRGIALTTNRGFVLNRLLCDSSNGLWQRMGRWAVARGCCMLACGSGT